MPSSEIYFDVIGNKLVKNLNSTETLTLKWFQGLTVPLKCFPVAPTGNTVSAPFYKKIYTAGHTFELVLGPAAGVEAIKAAQYTWTPVATADSDGLSGYFDGSINLNTDEMNAAIGTAATYDTKAEFRLFNQGTLEYITQVDVSILAVVKDPGSVSSIPTPAAEYVKLTDLLEMCPLWDNRNRPENAGRNIIFVSPDSTHLRETGVDNNGDAIDNRY